MEKRQQAFLHFRRQINQKVPAAHEIHLGKGWVHDEVLGCKNDHLPDAFGDLIAVLDLKKELFQAFR